MPLRLTFAVFAPAVVIGRDSEAADFSSRRSEAHRFVHRWEAEATAGASLDVARWQKKRPAHGPEGYCSGGWWRIDAECESLAAQGWGLPSLRRSCLQRSSDRARPELPSHRLWEGRNCRDGVRRSCPCMPRILAPCCGCPLGQTKHPIPRCSPPTTTAGAAALRRHPILLAWYNYQTDNMMEMRR